jgi:hypothetical protein
MSEKDYSVQKNSGIKMCRYVQERVVRTGGKLIICKRAQEIGRSCIVIYRHSKHCERRCANKILIQTDLSLFFASEPGRFTLEV